MDYADAIRRQAEDAPRAALPAVTAALWRAFGDGRVTEAEAEVLSALIEARQVFAKSGGNLRSPILPRLRENSRAPVLGAEEGLHKSEYTPQGRQNGLRTGIGSRPRTDASIERRRRWASSGRLPPALASRFTLSEQAALSLIAAETTRRGDCRLSVPHMAALVGIAETTVRNAIREARQLGLLTVEERRLTGFRNDTNVVRIVSPEWTAWLRLARKGVAYRDPLGRKGEPSRYPLGGDPLRGGGGCKFANRTPTQVSKQGKTGAVAPDLRRSARRRSPT